MASWRAEARLRGKLVCSKCYREFDRSHILWCGKCNQDLLCSACGNQHVEETERDVGGLSDIHNKMLLRYCKSCKRVICDVCEAGRHSSQGHDVVDYWDIIKQGLKDLESHIDEAWKTKFTALIGQIDKLVDLQEETIKKKDHLSDVINDVYGCGSVSEAIDLDIAKMEDGIKYHQEEIEKLKADIQDAEQKKRRQDEDFQKKKVLLDQLSIDFDSNLDSIKSAHKEKEGISDKLKELLGRGTLMTKEKVLPSRFLNNIESTNTEISGLGAHAGEDRFTLVKEMTTKTSAFGLSEDYIRSAGVFTKASLSKTIMLGDPFLILGISFLTQYQVAVCGCSSVRYNGLVPPFKLILLDMELTKQTVLMSEDITLFDVKKFNKNELVVLCRADPLLRIVDIRTKQTRCIKVKLSVEAIESVRQVEVTKQGRFVVTYHFKPMRMILIDINGDVLHDIDINGNWLTVCSLTDTIFTCSYGSNIISQYQLHDNSVTEVQSLLYRLAGFECTYINSGSLGEVFVIGGMKGEQDTVQMYQVVFGEDGKLRGMKCTTESDSSCSDFFGVKLAVNHSNIVIGIDSVVRLYKLE